MKNYRYYVYILTNKRNTVFYIGVTNNIVKRVYEHRMELVEGFTKKYKVKKLVYVEEFKDINEAIRREKLLKTWNRVWKLDLIRKVNPSFEDMLIEA